MCGSQYAVFIKVRVIQHIFVDTGCTKLFTNQIINVTDKLKLSFTLLNKLWFSFEKFSQNSQLLGGTLWRSITTNYPNRS